ncbi:benzoyl-CoA 2,3-epoxidase subunit BoxA [Alloalcanivorax xenomutans]|uniref:benzoyl-CoA 2,3-epoxidase subunit BoxA n=1 Tax=Alloalcanivorax xenomutans TaxID=1094342 RepID=UPI0006D5C099|nr:benzoyl-CoA 2,3-epoxidase subunit BoxA [Alloalcanivorax xenomutans]WOA33506.1 benzoyl-CoA 2,3-epoxidase subunit BoxA [Alloalcanivorax xenomutans]CUR47381.1 Benzoyl-CoA oxygenase component A [Alloalcanivorax xenomutans]
MSLLRQHLIDPEICIRCNTCEETCPIDAVTHNEDNYVVDADKCNYCMDCIAPCPTGAIDNWRLVNEPFTIEQQFEWDELPEENTEALSDSDTPDDDDEVRELLAQAHAGVRARAPDSAGKPLLNMFTRSAPARARVVGNYRITAEDTESDIRHIVLDFGATAFPVLEGQSVGILPPGQTGTGKPHKMRLYSVASPRDGERPNHNNLSLTVKRVNGGVASNFICDLNKGDEVEVVGPFGDSFLMPEHPDANIIMICTGTGSAPFRAMTERRRRKQPDANGRLVLFFGARTPNELPYFGPLSKLPDSLIHKELVFSRLPDADKEYVQHRMKARGNLLGELLGNSHTHIYICGLKGMEQGVEESLHMIAEKHGLDWPVLRDDMVRLGRYHVETY